MSIFADQGEIVVEDKDYLTELVGDGKKFKDAQALARGKAEADAFIERIKTEQEELRKELDKRLTVEELWTKIQQAGKSDTTEPNKEDNQEPSAGGKQLTTEDIRRQIREELEASQKAVVSNRNLEAVTKALRETFGAGYVQKVKEIAKTLGVGEAFLDDLAASQPQAFLKLVGAKTDGVQNTTSVFNPQPAVVTTPTKTGNVKNFAYYEKIRKENPRQYFGVELQNEMWKQAQELGEDFYKG